MVEENLKKRLKKPPKERSFEDRGVFIGQVMIYDYVIKKKSGGKSYAGLYNIFGFINDYFVGRI